MSNAKETAKLDIADIAPGTGFVMISVELKKILRDFLNKRPFEEVDHILETAFRDEDLEKMWSDVGFIEFVKLLRTMPREEVKPILDMLANPKNEKDIQWFVKNPEFKEEVEAGTSKT